LRPCFIHALIGFGWWALFLWGWGWFTSPARATLHRACANFEDETQNYFMDARAFFVDGGGGS
jgi:hypothetical protein